MWMIAVTGGLTGQVGWLNNWFEGWRPSGDQNAFIKWTGWTLAMASPWWHHHKHCHWYY